MLKPEDFSNKYDTEFAQINEEEFIKTVSAEDLDTYSEAEILTGRNLKGGFNKFNRLGKNNRGYRKSTTI